MRLFLKDSERRPDPAPVETDDRWPVLVGLVAWLAALAGLLIFSPDTLLGDGGVLWTIVAGLVIGVLGFGFAQFRRRKP